MYKWDKLCFSIAIPCSFRQIRYRSSLNLKWALIMHKMMFSLVPEQKFKIYILDWVEILKIALDISIIHVYMSSLILRYPTFCPSCVMPINYSIYDVFIHFQVSTWVLYIWLTWNFKTIYGTIKMRSSLFLKCQTFASSELFPFKFVGKNDVFIGFQALNLVLCIILHWNFKTSCRHGSHYRSSLILKWETFWHF